VFEGKAYRRKRKREKISMTRRRLGSLLPDYARIVYLIA
jgi:hypothetical protein